MNALLAVAVALAAAITLTASDDYTITILESLPVPDTSLFEIHTSEVPAGGSIPSVFGPIAEVRVGFMGSNRTFIDDDSIMVEQRVRERLDSAICLGPDSEVAWHKAPWMRGYILFEDERVLSVQILLSGIIIGDLLFAEE